MFLVLPLTGLLLYVFYLEQSSVQEPIDQRAAVLGVAESPVPDSAGSEQSRVVVPRPEKVPVVTATPGAVREVPPRQPELPVPGNRHASSSHGGVRGRPNGNPR